MLYAYIGTLTRGPPIHVIKLSTNIKIVKSLKFSVNTVLKYKMLKYQDEWAFVSPYDGLGGPPIFYFEYIFFDFPYPYISNVILE
jgi:hypothetical protein